MWENAMILGLLVVVGYWIFHPLLRPDSLESYAAQGKELQENALGQRKEDVYVAIKEMDFDFGMGKISEEDYQELRSQYKAQALEILKELDTIQGGEDIQAEIEREVQQLRDKREPGGKGSNGKESV